MKPRQLILHAGPHKTGTSAIQKVLGDGTFKRFYYPKTGQWADGAHHQLVFSLIPELRRADAESLEPEELLLRLRKELHDVTHERLLISSEFLSTGCAARVVNWLVSHEITDSLGIRAILVERDVLSRAASLYNQAVKDPYVGETRSPDQWLKDEFDSLSLDQSVKQLQALGASVEVVPYEPASSLVPRVLLAAGAQMEELPEDIPWCNQSMSYPVLMELLAVNRRFKDPQKRIELRTRLFATHRPAFTRSAPDLFSHLPST